MDSEVSHLRKLFGDLEQQLAEARALEQQAGDEFAKLKDERDTLADLGDGAEGSLGPI